MKKGMTVLLLSIILLANLGFAASNETIQITVNPACSKAFGEESLISSNLLVQQCTNLNTVLNFLPIPQPVIIFLLATWIAISHYKEALGGTFKLLKLGIIAVALILLFQVI